MRVRSYSQVRVVFKLDLKRRYLFYEIRYLEFVCIVRFYTLTMDDTGGQLNDSLFTLPDTTTKGYSDDRIAMYACARVHGLFPFS
jgi:hypothetical protein